MCWSCSWCFSSLWISDRRITLCLWNFKAIIVLVFWSDVENILLLKCEYLCFEYIGVTQIRWKLPHPEWRTCEVWILQCNALLAEWFSILCHSWHMWRSAWLVFQLHQLWSQRHSQDLSQLKGQESLWDGFDNHADCLPSFLCTTNHEGKLWKRKRNGFTAFRIHLVHLQRRTLQPTSNLTTQPRRKYNQGVFEQRCHLWL